MDIREDTEPQSEVAPPVGSIATPLNHQPGIEHAPSDWSLWLLPLAALMLLAGAVAIYLLPTNFNLLLPICFWLLLATALLAVAAWRTIPNLASSLNDAVRHRPNGELITWNRFASLISLLLAGVLVAALATIGMFIFALATPSLYVVNREVAQPFVLLVTSAIIIFLLLLAWLAPIRPLQKFLQLRFAGAGILVIPVFIYVALNPWLPSVLYNRSVYTGPGASWPVLVQFARHEADRIDKDAVLYDVSGYVSQGPYSTQTSLFYMEFMFVSPTGEDFSIELLDANPIRLVYVSKHEQSLISSYAYAHERFADWFAYIKLGPREVYSLTEKEAIAFAQRNGINVAKFQPHLGMSLLFTNIWSSQYGVPAIWDIGYISENASKSLDLYVDGTTGEVLARRPYPDENTATPTPPPPATASPTP